MATVSLVRGDNRYSNIRKSLELIKEELAEKIKGKKRIIIKPNFVTIFRQLAATHVDAVRAVLDVISKLTDEPITIAEGAAVGLTRLGYLRYGYYKLRKKYNVRLVDLNKDAFSEIEVFDANLQPMPVKVAKTALDSDFRISVCPLKTHDTVVVTLSIKNLAMGSLCGLRMKQSIHQGYPAINKTLFKLAQIVPPHLSVIDGFTAMEGNGPCDGDPVEMKIALAGTDALAVDTVGTHLMGFDIDKIGYLHYCKEARLGKGEISKIEIIGNASLEACQRKFRPHDSYQEQLKWEIEYPSP